MVDFVATGGVRTAVPSGTPDLYHTANFDTSVGARFTIIPEIQDGLTQKISEVDYTTPHSLGTNSIYSATVAQARPLPPTTVAKFSLGTLQTKFSGFSDNTVGVDTIVVTVKYQNLLGSQTVAQDTFTFNLNVMAPTGTLRSKFPDQTGTNAFQFGPWLKGKALINGWNVPTFTPVSWGNIGMLASRDADPIKYGFGF